MASIKNLQMADTVLSNPNVEYRKGFMGLGSKAIYRPTGSPIAAQVLDYTAPGTRQEAGQRHRHRAHTDRQQSP